MLNELLEQGISERGNSAFGNDEGSTVLFAEIKQLQDGKFQFLQVACTPTNYPMWEVSTITTTKEDLVNHITYTLGGWYASKCNLNVNLTDDRYVLDDTDIVESVVDHAINQAHSNDYNPLQTTGMVSSGMWDSAIALKYQLTDKLHADCCELFESDFDPSDIS